MQVINETTFENRQGIREDSLNPALAHLQSILVNYLAASSNLSLNGLSKRCAVSEPTLRRIKKGHVKTLPSITTIVDLLSYISRETETKKIIEAFPGPIAEHIKDKAQQIEEVKNLEFSEVLSKSLKDPIKYVLYKLASNPCGITSEKAAELFGSYGERQLSVLSSEELVELKGAAYFAKIKHFALSNDVFVDHFKTLADFIKPHKHASARREYSPIFSNYSSSINKQAYSEILRVQRAAQRKIARILSDEKSSGDIPTFVLNAIDTIDNQCADEFPDED